MGIQAMKVHQLPRGLIWDHEPPSLTLGCKRFRPLAPKLPPSASAAAADTLSSTTSTATFDLKSFIKPDQCSPRRAGSSDAHKKESSHHQVEAAQPGGTRWNPTQEQIGILEMLYRSGMRTPNAQQIEQITLQLAKYGKIEGKNVFYWFQNHKARERQKQKRTTLALSSMHPTTPTPTPPPPFPDSASSSLFLSSSSSTKEDELVENNRCKRKCMTWQSIEEVKIYCGEEDEEEEEEDRTLKLFPLHPEGRSSLRDDSWN